jgi:ribulose-5-phosphate 4-epimerase/fuculose-1-phosphate aldolase
MTPTAIRASASSRTNINAAELEARRQLAACYRNFGLRNMDDMIYTHLSARIPGRPGRFLFIPFGMFFEEVTASNLMEVDIEGNDVANSGQAVNPAGWIVHRVVYEAAPDSESVMHLHTVCGTAVSAQKSGLLPVNQFAVTYSGQIAYHDYDGPGLRPDEQKKFIANLDGKLMMFLRNHGTLARGRSIAEAYTLMHYLERTCEIQIAAQAGGGPLVTPAEEIIENTVATAQGVGDSTFGRIGFEAMLRRVDRESPSYRD